MQVVPIVQDFGDLVIKVLEFKCHLIENKIPAHLISMTFISSNILTFSEEEYLNCSVKDIKLTEYSCN